MLPIYMDKQYLKMYHLVVLSEEIRNLILMKSLKNVMMKTVTKNTYLKVMLKTLSTNNIYTLIYY